MAWNTYTQLMSGKKEEEIVQIYENIVVPLMGGSKVIHVRTHEEKRLEGICESFSDFNDELEVLHICSDSGVISIPLFEEETDEDTDESTSLNNDDKYALPQSSRDPHDSYSAHVDTLNRFIQSGMTGILLFMDSDRTLQRDFQFIRMLKTFSMAPVVSPKYVILHTVEAETPNTLSRQIQFYDLPLPKDYTLRQSLREACDTAEVDCSMPKGKALEETNISNGKLGDGEKASPPSAETWGTELFSSLSIVRFSPEGKTSGRLVRLCAEIGVISMTSASG